MFTLDSVNHISALKLFRADPRNFDLIITDQIMPKMTGLTLAEEILRLRPEIPVIITTGHSSMVNEQTVKGKGIKGFLTKPFISHNLARKIREVLDGDDKQPVDSEDS